MKDNRNALLSDLYEFQYGTGNTIENIGGDYPIYGSNGVVGFTNIFNSEDAPVIGHIGAYAGIVNWASGKHYVTYNGVICKIRKGINPRYGYYVLQNSKLQRRLRGSTQPFISYDLLNDVKVYLPDKAIQDNIASVLSALDTKIELNNRINHELEAMAKIIYDYWFMQFDFPDNNGNPYKSSGGKMVWSDELKREVPAEWEITELRKYLTSSRGVSYNGNDINGSGAPMINLNSFNSDSTYKPDGIKLFSGSYSPSKILKPFDLVMCNTQQTALDPQKDIIGKSVLVPDIFDSDIVSSHHVTTIGVKNDALKYYLNTLFNTDFFHRYISGYATGTNILGLNFDGVLSYKTAIPHDDLLEKYKSIILKVEKQKSETIKENQKLKELRDWLLPMLMTGQVKVKDKAGKATV